MKEMNKMIYLELVGDSNDIRGLIDFISGHACHSCYHVAFDERGISRISGYVWLLDDSAYLEEDLQKFKKLRGTVQVFEVRELKQYNFQENIEVVLID